jgi:hypothetical protein
MDSSAIKTFVTSVFLVVIDFAKIIPLCRFVETGAHFIRAASINRAKRENVTKINVLRFWRKYFSYYE